jgi:hypothetical protein
MKKTECQAQHFIHHSLSVAIWEHLDKSFQQNQCLDDRLESEIGSAEVQMGTFEYTGQQEITILRSILHFK